MPPKDQLLSLEVTFKLERDLVFMLPFQKCLGTVFPGCPVLRAAQGAQRHSGPSWDGLLIRVKLWLMRSEQRWACSSWEGHDSRRCGLSVWFLSHRFITHILAAADGGRWAGLRGCRDRPRIPLLLSSLVCATVIFEK